MKLLSLIIWILAVTASSAVSAEPTAYVINTSGETLSKINLTTGAVTNDILPLGSDLFSFPNQIIVRDSMAYVVASGTNEIQLINLNTETTVGFISTGDGTNPYWMAFLDEQYAYVTTLLTGRLLKLDMQAMTVVDSIDLQGKSPEGVAVHDGKLYVALTGFDFNTFLYDPGMVAVVDPAGDSLVGHVPVGTNPQFLDVDQNGEIHVVCTGDYASAFGRSYIIDGVDDTVIDSVVLGGNPGMIAIGPDDVAAVAAGGFATSGYVYTYSTSDNTPYHTESNPLPVDSGCTGVAVFQDSTWFTATFADVVRQIDSAGVSQGTFSLGDGPVHLAFNYQPGDINGDWVADPVDLSAMVDFLFSGGTSARWPIWRGDVNGDGAVVDPVDLSYFVDFLYSGGAKPRMGRTWVR